MTDKRLGSPVESRSIELNAEQFLIIFSAFAKRLNEFRQGCSVLILADHQALSDDQRAWLKERCRTWAAKFEAALVKVEAGGDLAEIRSEVDGIVRTLVDSLNSRAAQT